MEAIYLFNFEFARSVLHEEKNLKRRVVTIRKLPSRSGHL